MIDMRMRVRALVLGGALALALPVAAEPVNALRVAAASGDASAQMRLAEWYAGSGTVAHNTAQAFAWRLRAARQGHVPAYVPVAQAYHDGRGVAKDIPRAMWWFENAARAGNATAQNEVAYHQAVEGGDMDRALGLVDQALATQPANPHYLDTKATILERKHRWREAEELLRRAHAVAPADPELQEHLARVERRRR